jgi:hypothetical protein
MWPLPGGSCPLLLPTRDTADDAVLRSAPRGREMPAGQRSTEWLRSSLRGRYTCEEARRHPHLPAGRLTRRGVTPAADTVRQRGHDRMAILAAWYSQVPQHALRHVSEEVPPRLRRGHTLHLAFSTRHRLAPIARRGRARCCRARVPPGQLENGREREKRASEQAGDACVVAHPRPAVAWPPPDK